MTRLEREKIRGNWVAMTRKRRLFENDITTRSCNTWAANCVPINFALKLSDVCSQDGGAAEVGKLLRLRVVEDRNHGDRAAHHHRHHHQHQHHQQRHQQHHCSNLTPGDRVAQPGRLRHRHHRLHRLHGRVHGAAINSSIIIIVRQCDHNRNHCTNLPFWIVMRCNMTIFVCPKQHSGCPM